MGKGKKTLVPLLILGYATIFSKKAGSGRSDLCSSREGTEKIFRTTPALVDGDWIKEYQERR